MDGDELAYGYLFGQLASDFKWDISKYEVDDVVDEQQRKDRDEGCYDILVEVQPALVVS